MEWVVAGETYYAPVQDLPCVLELYKTDERLVYHKCIDVGQVSAAFFLSAASPGNPTASARRS